MFGGPGDPITRAAMTDEGLDLIDALWSGEVVDHQGTYYTARNVRFAPVPVQRPRIPIWIGGNSVGALRRAARWDGWLADTAAMDSMSMSTEELAARVRRIQDVRQSEELFDVIVSGYTAPGESDLPERYQQAGATWWLESIHDARGDLTAMTARIDAGPPCSLE